MLVEISAFVAQLGQLCEHDATDQHLLRAEGVSQRRVVAKDGPELLDDVEPLEDGVDTVVPADLRLSEVSIGIEQIAQLVKGLYQEELLLPLSQELDALLVVADHHCREDLMALAFRPDLEVAAALLPLLQAQVLRLDTELVVELPALLQALNAVVGVPLDVLQQAV